jgi:hypothetical protein
MGVSASFCVVLSCVGRGLALGWSPNQGVLRNVSICGSRSPLRKAKVRIIRTVEANWKEFPNIQNTWSPQRQRLCWTVNFPYTSQGWRRNRNDPRSALWGCGSEETGELVMMRRSRKGRFSAQQNVWMRAELFCEAQWGRSILVYVVWNECVLGCFFI